MKHLLYSCVMSRRIDETDVAAGGIFQRLGNFVARWPLLVIGFWIAAAAVLMLTLPPLPVVAAQHQAKPLPDYAPTMVSQRAMSGAFHETGAGSLLLLIMTDENGMSPADEDTYRKLIENLHQDTQDKISVQEFVTAPPLREILASKDNKAWNVPISFPGDIIAPETQAGYQRVAEIVKKTLAGSTLTAHYAGPVAIAADATEIGQHDMHVIEIGTGLLVLAILFFVYRNVVTMLVPLATIGISVVTAQGVLAGLAELGLATGLQTIVLMSAVMVGAGTDYAVFLISRYHDYVQLGVEFGSSGQECTVVHRQSHRRVCGHRRGHVSCDDLRHNGGLFHSRPGDFNRDHCGVPGCGHAASRHPRAYRATWLDQAAR